MKTVAVLSIASLAFGSVLERRACSGSECEYQITHTGADQVPLATRLNDCTSFMMVTVTPAIR
jgi:hypothetical protein